MFAIENVDRVLCFGCSNVVGYNRIGDEIKLDVLVRSMEQQAISHNSLLAKVMITECIVFVTPAGAVV